MSPLIHREPFSDLNRLLGEVAATGDPGERRFAPPADLLETDTHFFLRLDLPGLGEDDVSIEIDEGALSITGERRPDQREESAHRHRVERSFGRFSRTLALPQGIDPSQIGAVFDRGVLEVSIPKPERRRPRRIEIQRGPAEPTTVQGIATEPSPPAPTSSDGPQSPAEPATAEGIRNQVAEEAVAATERPGGEAGTGEPGAPGRQAAGPGEPPSDLPGEPPSDLPGEPPPPRYQ